ncbi:MAG: hypothetical protein IJ758_02635, partial [Clostridia bacterium]|nr:hypothetical protein [Clostridia bacterium]
YKDEKIAQGREKVKEQFKLNPKLSHEIEELVRQNVDKLYGKAAIAMAAKAMVKPIEVEVADSQADGSSATKANIDIMVED